MNGVIVKTLWSENRPHGSFFLASYQTFGPLEDEEFSSLKSWKKPPGFRKSSRLKFYRHQIIFSISKTHVQFPVWQKFSIKMNLKPKPEIFNQQVLNFPRNSTSTEMRIAGGLINPLKTALERRRDTFCIDR